MKNTRQFAVAMFVAAAILIPSILLIFALAPNYGKLRAACAKQGGILIRTVDENNVCIKREYTVEGDFRG